MYKAGEILRCTVSEKKGNFYLVTISGEGSAILKSDVELKNGDSVDACFVCMHEGQILLREIPSASQSLQQVGAKLEEQNLSRQQELKASSQEPLPARLVDFLFKNGTISSEGKSILLAQTGSDDHQTIRAILKELQNIETLSQADLESMEEGMRLISNGKISFEQFAVGYYDQLTVGISLLDSLKARGWLEH